MKWVVMTLITLLIGGCWKHESTGMTVQAKSPKVKIAVSLTPLTTPLFVAKNQKFFANNNIDVELVPCKGGVNCANLLQNGIVSYATTSNTVALFNQYEHNNVSVLASFVTSSNDLKLRTLEPLNITSMSDLSGKKVGIVKSSASELYFDLLLISNGLQALNVQRVFLDIEEMVPALLSYQVDAISVWEPYGYKSSVLSATQVKDLGLKGIYQLSFNLITHSHRTEKNEQEEAILYSIYQAIQWIDQNPNESIALISKELNVFPREVEWAWEDYIFELTNDYTLLSNLRLQARWASERSIDEVEPLDVRLLVDNTAYTSLQDKGRVK